MVGLACVAAMLLLVLLAGCGEQAGETDGELPTVTDDMDAVDQPVPDTGADAGAADIPESAETLADVVDSFTMPSSFRMTVAEGDNTQTMAMKMDGPKAAKMRVENEGPEATEVFIMDFENGEMISYNTGTSEGFRIPISEEEAADAPKPWDEYDETAKVTGSEEINGVDCWVVEMSPEGAEDVATVWIGKRDGLMRQVQDGEQVTTFSITEINEVPESTFEVPDEIEISEMPVPDMPEGEGGE